MAEAGFELGSVWLQHLVLSIFYSVFPLFTRTSLKHQLSAMPSAGAGDIGQVGRQTT